MSNAESRSGYPSAALARLGLVDDNARRARVIEASVSLVLTVCVLFVLTMQLPEDAELTWDAGDAHPEPCLDNVPPKIVSKNTAAMYLTGAIAFLGGVYTMAIVVDKPSTTPFAPKTFPYNGLEVELGGRKVK